MKLLIVTQVVDSTHPILGFFHRWIEEFAKHAEQVHVIALGAGEHALPSNVTVHSLGKEQGAGKLQQLATFYSLLMTLHKNYDAVFVHMNPEYVVAAGWWWRLTGKTIGLWYTHKSVDLKLRIAEFFANVVFTASKESFRLTSKKVQVVGHGIDTDFWTPDGGMVRGTHALSVGRLMTSKRHDLAIREAASKGFTLKIAGDGPERERLGALARECGATVEFLGALIASRLRSEYRSAARLIHRSETGSLDKVVLEAAACGCPVDTTDPALKLLSLTPEYVSTHHSLSSLIPRILSLYASA